MAVGPIISPRTLRFPRLPAITEDTIVVNDERVATHIKSDARSIGRVVCVLDQLVRKSSVSLEIAEARTENAKVVNASRQELRIIHLRNPSAEQRCRRSHSLQIAGSGGSDARAATYALPSPPSPSPTSLAARQRSASAPPSTCGEGRPGGQVLCRPLRRAPGWHGRAGRRSPGRRRVAPEGLEVSFAVPSWLPRSLPPLSFFPSPSIVRSPSACSSAQPQEPRIGPRPELRDGDRKRQRVCTYWCRHTW